MRGMVTSKLSDLVALNALSSFLLKLMHVQRVLLDRVQDGVLLANDHVFNANIFTVLVAIVLDARVHIV